MTPDLRLDFVHCLRPALSAHTPAGITHRPVSTTIANAFWFLRQQISFGRKQEKPARQCGRAGHSPRFSWDNQGNKATG